MTIWTSVSTTSVEITIYRNIFVQADKLLNPAKMLSYLVEA